MPSYKGWGLGIFGPTAIPVVAPGVSTTVSLVKGKLYDQSCVHKLRSLRVAHGCRAAAGLPPPSWLDDRRAMVSWARRAQREQETRTWGLCRMVTGRVRRRPYPARHGCMYDRCNICRVQPIVAATAPVRTPPYEVDATMRLRSREVRWG